MVTTTTWSIAMDFLCQEQPWMWSIWRIFSPVLSSFMTYHRVCNNSKTTNATLVHLRYLVGFVLLDHLYSVQCFADRCLSLGPFWHLWCLSIDLRRLDTFLAFSNIIHNFVWSGLEQTICCIRNAHDNHYTTTVITNYSKDQTKISRVRNKIPIAFWIFYGKIYNWQRQSWHLKKPNCSMQVKPDQISDHVSPIICTAYHYDMQDFN